MSKGKIRRKDERPTRYQDHKRSGKAKAETLRRKEVRKLKRA